MKYLLTLALSCLLVLGASAQNMLNVSGTVLDDKNEPVVGASVVVKGTSKGVITGVSGEYTIQAPANGTITISFVGMGEKEEVVNGRTSINVTLTAEDEQLDEVVVVGYGVQRKSDLTGALASVKVDDAIKSMPVARITDALQGRMAGVSIVNTSGQPGSSASIRVRGMNSIKGDGNPLVVIDGFIGGDMSSLNPADIASVEVLKDASAAAVYGSRAASGVILVTTKKVNKGAPQVTYNGYVNFKTPGKIPEQLSVSENAHLQNAYASERYGSSIPANVPTFTEEEISSLQGYDYISETFQDVALEQMHEVSINGGGENSRYLISGSFNNNDGIVRNSSATRANYRVKIDTDIKKWLKAGVNIWGTYSKSEGPSFGQYKNLLNYDLIFPRFVPAQDDQGNYNDIAMYYNPMRKVDKVKKDGYNYDSRLQGYVDFTILPGLTFRATGGVTLKNSNTQTANVKDSYQATFDGYTSANASNSNTFSWLNSNILSYIKEFNKDHRINATLVFEQEYNETFANSANVSNLYDDNIAYNNLSYADRTSAISSRIKTTMMSGLARVNYVLFDRYMLTASYRYDGSSRLAAGNYWHGFPSAALAWDIKKENFMENFEWLNQSKLRVGYGITGNQAVPAYSAFSESTFKKDQSGVGIAPIRRSADLEWERTTEYNAGLDLGFFSNRITLSADYYHKYTKDVILEVALPPTVGYSYTWKNSAEILNQGVEFTIGADPVVNTNFRWHTDVTLTRNVGTLERIDGVQQSMWLNGLYEVTAYNYIVGEKIGTMWGYANDGIYKSTDNVPAGLSPGAYRYKDINVNPDGTIGDGITDYKDQGIIGCGQPTFSWGWNNTLTYMNFDLSLFIIGFHGFDIFNNNDWLTTIDGRYVSPNPDWNNRWTPTNEDTDIPGFVNNNNDKPISSRKVEKGDFIKLKNLTLGYTLPRNLLQKAGIVNLRVYASLQNLYTITEYSGMDPEVTLKSPLTPGADWGYYPNGRNFLVGVNFTF